MNIVHRSFDNFLSLSSLIFYNEVLTGPVKVTAIATLRREGREKGYYFFPQRENKLHDDNKQLTNLTTLRRALK